MATNRQRLGLAGVAAAAVGTGLALRRSLRSLDAADVERVADTDTTFPAGQRVDVDTDDGAVIATESVGDGPGVVLVHGITSSRHDWGPVARRLVERGYTVIGVDQRGHGDSTVGSAGFGAERLGADLAQVLAALQTRNVVLVGHSMGGIAAMSFALDAAPAADAALDADARVRSMVLVATTPSTPRLFRRPPTWLIELALGRADKNRAIGRPALARSLFGRFGSSQLVEAALRSARRARPKEIAACAAGLVGYDITDRLGEITIPTHCLYGTQDVVTAAGANRRIADSIPGATATEIDGAGHLLIWTHATDIADEVEVASRR